MRNPEGKGIGYRFFIGETAPGPFSLKLPVQIGRQPHGCFDRRTGAHTTRSPNFGIVLQKAIAGRRVNRVHPAGQPPSLRGRILFQYQNKLECNLYVFLPDGEASCKKFVPNSERSAVRTRIAAPSRRGIPSRLVSATDLDRNRGRGKRPKFNTINMNLFDKCRHFSALLLANRWYLLYKV
jgi:hypothetical protein